MFVEENQANIIAEVIRIFWCCHLEKGQWFFVLLMEGLEVTLQIPFLHRISLWWWMITKTPSRLIFWRNNAIYELDRAIDISSQAREQSFSSSTVCKTRSCCTRELACQQVRGMWPQNILCCYNVLIVNCDNKRSNQRLMNIFFRKRAISANFCKISKIKDRREKPYDFLNNISLICFSINMKFPLLQKISKVVYIS